MTTEQLLAIVALGGVLAAVWLAAKANRALERLNVRLDEQGRHGEHLSQQLREQARDTDEVVRRLDHDLREQQTEARETLLEQLSAAKQHQQDALHRLEQSLIQSFAGLRASLDLRHSTAMGSQQEALERAISGVHQRLGETLTRTTSELSQRMDVLTTATDRKLLEISGQVERRLSEGFDKTTATFTDIVQRLAVIDEAQKKITELSTNVVELQDVLANRSARGAFGEVQLEGLVKDLLPQSAYRMQHTLANSNRVDCVLFLPPPTGHVPIDSKFPLENYRRKLDTDLSPEERKFAEAAFARDVRTHIQSIAGQVHCAAGDIGRRRDVHPGRSSVRGNPFEPSRLGRGSLPDAGLDVLADHIDGDPHDGPRGAEGRGDSQAGGYHSRASRQALPPTSRASNSAWTSFGTHIRQANDDVDKVHTSARKITSRFGKIERLELDNDDADQMTLLEEPTEEEAEAQGA